MGGTSDKNIKEEIFKRYNLDINSNLIIKGNYSDIYKTKNDKNEDLSIKIINKNKILKLINNIKEQDLDKIFQEKINMMININNKSEYSIRIIEKINTKIDYYIIMDYCNSNLKEYLNKFSKEEKGIYITKIKDIFKKLNEALTVIENNKMFHGDIKPEHILINEKDENDIKPILIDYFNFNSMTKDYSLYIAPEILINENETNNFDIQSDLWSIGLILYELYFNKLPFNSKEDLINMTKNNNNLILSKIQKDKNLNDLVEKLLKIKKDERISFNEYINHNFWKEEKQKQNNIQISQPKPIENNKPKEIIKKKTIKDPSNQKEVIFEFETENLNKELEDFIEKDFKETEIFRYTGNDSKKSKLKDTYIMEWLGKLKFSNLMKLDLSENDFESLEGLGNLELGLLTELNLSHNKLKDISELQKVKFENLTSLDLSENQISNFEGLTKCKFENLTILNLSDNLVNNITFLANLNFNQLSILNLGFNQIQNIDALQKGKFTNLNVLYLNNNQIDSINVLSQIHLEKLQILNLSNNNIRKIDSLKKAKLKMLKELNLSFNKIDDINILNSIPLNNLESLNLSFNKISKISILEEIKLKSLKKISIYGNDEINFDSVFIKNIIEELQNKNINVI